MVKKRKKKRSSRYVGKYPINSRITIDYSGKKPDVKFDYPEKDKKSIRTQVVFSTAVMMPAAIITFIMMFVIASNIIYPSARGYPSIDDCEVYLNYYNGSTDFIGLTAECIIDGEVHRMATKYQKGRKVAWLFPEKPRLFSSEYEVSTSGPHMIGALANAILMVLILFSSMFVLFHFYTKTKLGQRWFPEINKKMSNARYYTKIDSVSKDKTIELPLFNNVYLDYRAKEEFGKYLERVEIREHPFDKIIRKGKGRKRYRGRKKGQVYLWKATFYFKQIPKKGYLEMWWT